MVHGVEVHLPDRILSQNRIERLESIGFDWDPVTGRSFSLSSVIVILKHSRASLDTAMFPRDTPRVSHRGRGVVR